MAKSITCVRRIVPEILADLAHDLTALAHEARARSLSCQPSGSTISFQYCARWRAAQALEATVGNRRNPECSERR
jgi:hypothetical protein